MLNESIFISSLFITSLQLDMKKIYFLFFYFCTFILTAQQKDEAPPAISAIKATELKNDIFALASDAMRGRRRNLR